MCIQSFDVPTRSRLPAVLRTLSALVFAAAAMLGAWSARAEDVDDLGSSDGVRPDPSIGHAVERRGDAVPDG